MATKKKKLQSKTMARKVTPMKGSSPRSTLPKPTTTFAKGAKSSQTEFERLCLAVVKETSVVARVDRVKAAQANYVSSQPADKRGRVDAIIASSYLAISRLTGLSKRQVQYDLEIAKIHRSAKQLLLGKPIANRTLLLLDLAKVGDWRQQVHLAKISGDIRKFTKALAEVVSKKVKVKPPVKPAIVPIVFDETIEFVLSNRLYQAVLTRGTDGMSLTIHPKLGASEAAPEKGVEAPPQQDIEDAQSDATPEALEGVKKPTEVTEPLKVPGGTTVKAPVSKGPTEEPEGVKKPTEATEPLKVPGDATAKASVSKGPTEAPDSVKRPTEVPEQSKVPGGTAVKAPVSKGPTTGPLSLAVVPVRTR